MTFKGLEQFKDVADVLESELTPEELAKLATDLPFDQRAANAVWESWTQHVDAKYESVIRWVTPPNPGDKSHRVPYSKSRAALYCAAASKHGLAKMLTVQLEIAKQRLAELHKCNDMIEFSRRPGLELFHKHFTDKDRPNGKAEEDAGVQREEGAPGEQPYPACG